MLSAVQEKISNLRLKQYVVSGNRIKAHRARCTTPVSCDAGVDERKRN